MKVDYKLEKEDYFKFNMHQMKEFPSLKKSVLIQRLMMPIIFLVFVITLKQRNQYSTPILVLGYLLVAGLWFFLYPKYIERSIKKRLNQTLENEENAFLLEDKAIELDKEAIYEYRNKLDEEGNETIEKVLAAEEIVAFQEDDNSYYIYLGSESAYIIPKRFIDQEDRETFLDLVGGLLLKGKKA